MLGAEVRVMLEGWWRVFHQSTEYLIIGKLNKPMIPITEDILFAFSFHVYPFLLNLKHLPQIMWLFVVWLLFIICLHTEHLYLFAI